jgi:hypothetical protein
MLGEKKPLHCRLSTQDKYGFKLHIWYVLNYMLDAKNPQALREWSIYLKTHPTIPGGNINELEPDTEKLKQIFSEDTENID